MEIVTGAYLKDLRERAGLSQAELARHAGVTQAHVAKIEGGKVDPRLSTVNHLLEVLEKGEAVKTCGEIMKKRIVKARMGDRVTEIIRMMKKLGISQIPVFERGRVVGSVTERTIVKNMGRNLSQLKVKDIVDGSFPIVDIHDSVEVLRGLLEFHQAVLVEERGTVKGIVTKANLLGIK